MDDSDSTVEETLVMLNIRQLNNDEEKIKNLNRLRKKKGEKIYIESDHGYDNKKKNEEQNVDEITKNEEQNKDEITGNKKNYKNDCNDNNSCNIDFHNDIKSNTKKDMDNENNNMGNNICIDNIPLEINNITLNKLFDECPQCIINKKYIFKGIHTSSIGTNLFFKEPENHKNLKNDAQSDFSSIENININKQNANKITRDDFSTYQGYSTKIISFEIDY
ncbi:conserved Plasmodium protein, unknown function [Plasmodium reichenowi]|uniref:Uncharacterized protein n=1 Tax=Plasmodium reichenowi TaxID=5854 RepID=A0A060RXU4_PLARE|nr:hypothetical protein PRSY57_1336900 [Plasmodium reichenowi]KYN94807.1 hypothetical protein PRSY57_1336900 [Plasmodium reichenowi]CDO66168.1 conserved Plasmodium protein, unknown function [Plasmodium reichenowi]SOV82012.1 conserved Plasmodium protein, unknown function [Plasmodium reichenowi]